MERDDGEQDLQALEGDIVLQALRHFEELIGVNDRPEVMQDLVVDDHREGDDHDPRDRKNKQGHVSEHVARAPRDIVRALIDRVCRRV